MSSGVPRLRMVLATLSSAAMTRPPAWMSSAWADLSMAENMVEMKLKM